MLRRYAGPGITFLLGLGWTLTGWESEAGGIALLAGAALWAVALLPPFRSIRVERGAPGEGFAIRFAPPVIFRKRRLRSDTLELVKDIREYVAAQSPSRSNRWYEMTRALQRGDEEEARRLLQEDSEERSAQLERERRELGERFGGRVTYVVAAFQQRRMLTNAEGSKLKWMTQSNHWIVLTANELEALARRL